MPSLAEMRETVERLLGELRTSDTEEHRLREIETILRLLMRHLNRSVADAANRLGHIQALEAAAQDLRQMRDAMTWVETHREPQYNGETQRRLAEATAAASAVLLTMERL